tara:strand:+ start:11567 stop:12322 length:756 start_codon:yes stop_codon:yes gene_type:complete
MNFKKRIDNIEEFKQLISHEPHYGTPDLPFSQEKDFEELADFFKGKRVAIVGPAPDLVGQNKEEEIDNYDIICKVGEMFNINDTINYGTKCNVLFLGCFPNLEDHKSHKPKNINKKNIQKIICPIKSCIPGIYDVHKRDIWKHYNYLKSELPEINFYNIGILSCLFDNEAKTRSTLGTFAINFLLKQDLKELGIYGFTWYKTSGYHSQYGQQNIGSHGYSHNIEISYLKQLIINSKFKIYLNKEVAKVLNL